ncbi:MAG TPA: VanW family protein [Gaiellaceae bacterium]|nr:VanW family protein [Gaiellaceae bacterium]
MGRRLLLVLLSLVAVATVLGLVFAGSPTKLANGVTIDGVDVGGLEAADARRLLQRRSEELARRPVVFEAGGRRFAIRPVELGVEPNWDAAVRAAQRQGDGFGPLRGFRRLDVQVFGADVAPPVTVLTGALRYELELIGRKVNRPPRDAALVRTGRGFAVVPARPGRVVDTREAERTVVRALATLDRAGVRVPLPLRVQQPRVRAPQLARALRQARLAVSAPVRLRLGKTYWKLTPKKLAPLLELPRDGTTSLAVGGPAAEAWLARLGRRVGRPAEDATFAVDGSHVTVVPARPGYALDARGTSHALLAAALRRTPSARLAVLPVREAQPKLTTQAARAMHIRDVVGTYTTLYGGIANRIHNVQLVAHLVDDKLIAPGETFSFNKTTGERNAAKGFLEAPVIVNGELTTGLGGGVCQVSTTVFNAAFEAGLKITERTNHALYISHYPQGRDATVDYPSLDLKFVNDTGHWLLLRTFVSSSSLTVSLYGTSVHRRVESTTAPLVAHGAPPVQKTIDASLRPGEKVVDDPGVPAMSTSVTRDVYTSAGRLLYHDVWYSSYRAEPKLVRLGPAKHPKKAKTSTTTTSTTPSTTTTPSETTTRPTQ